MNEKKNINLPFSKKAGSRELEETTKMKAEGREGAASSCKQRNERKEKSLSAFL